MKKHVILSLPLVAALIFGYIGVSSVLEYKKNRSLEAQKRQMRNQINTAVMIEDHSEAISLYKTVSPVFADVQLRILQRQWHIALEMVDHIRLAKYNDVLADEIPVLYKHLLHHLDDMHDRCSYVLTEFEPLNLDIAWRAYNIKGAVNLLRAFVVLATEKIWKKVRGTMKEAISDLKSAVELVDRTDAPNFEKNIPRWNLELLQANEYIRKVAVSKMEAERRLDLRENLEAIIPEKGGYAPGEPIERRMKK